MTKIRIQVLALLTLISVLAYAQEDNKKGYLMGSFETNTIYYKDDSRTKAESPENYLGSNNYLKLDYYQGRFAVGVQLETYEPALVEYPAELEKARLTNYYVSQVDKDFSVTAGMFYEQFGNGLLLRSWEDRMLGLNSAVMGAQFTYNCKNITGLKVIWRTPRFGMDFSDTQIRGIDVSFSLPEILNWQNTSLNIEGGALNRYEKISIDLEEEGGKPYSDGFSGRTSFKRSGFTAKGEYVDNGNKYYDFIHDGRLYMRKYAGAQLPGLGCSGNGLGVNLTERRLEWMNSEIITGNGSTSNLLNHTPAMSTQYTYMLTNLHPHTPQMGDVTNAISGEMGGQLDIFYHFKGGTAIGGKRGLKLHINFSTYCALEGEGIAQIDNLSFRDFGTDVEEQWTRSFKMNLFHSVREYSLSYGTNKTTNPSNIFVADLQYKFTPSFSARMELQYLTTKEDQKDRMAALLEINFTPAWSIYGSDMYNHGRDKIHYYNVGASYAKSCTRVTLGYGRNRKGYAYSGGVCRTVPRYTGADLTITTSF